MAATPAPPGSVGVSVTVVVVFSQPLPITAVLSVVTGGVRSTFTIVLTLAALPTRSVPVSVKR